MQRSMLKSKIHRARVTDSDLNYEGSIEIDQALMKSADILPYEEVWVWNLANGARFSTYVIPAPEGSGRICVNGAASRLAQEGDLVIIASFVQLEEEELASHQPRLVFVDENNRIKSVSTGSGMVRSVK